MNPLREIQQRLRALRPTRDPDFTARYVGSVGHEKRQKDEQSRMKFLGLSSPQLQALTREEFSFSALPLKREASIWLELYHSTDVFEEKALALTWFGMSSRREWLLARPSMVFGLQRGIDNWAISDDVADLVANLVERNPKQHLPRLQRWNRSTNPWERRQSLVGLYCYARQRKKPLPAKLSLPLVEALVDDRHYFVQKSVGWSLREIYQVDRKAQLAFVSKHVGRFSGTAFSTVIEKYSPAERARIRELR